MIDKKIIIIVVSFVFVIWLSGCINKATVDRHPTFKLESIESLHIRNSDGGGDELIPVIGGWLELSGYKVTSGQEVSPDADAVITYRDRWMWDLTMYMIELTVYVRDIESNFPLATGNSMHGSLTRKTQEEMVNEVLTNIFGETKLANDGVQEEAIHVSPAENDAQMSTTTD